MRNIHNGKLSRERPAAVAKALASKHGIGAEAGRAKNRRVEMVLR